VTAGVSDGGTLSYQWYSNTTESVSGGTLLPEISDTLTVPIDTLGKVYYYVVITNTNNGVNGERTASITSDVATVTVAIFATANFYENGTTHSISAVLAEDINLPAPAPIIGYTFDGWYIDNDGSEETSPYELNADTNFYAKWTPNDPSATPTVKAVFYDDYIEVPGISIEEYPVNYITLPTTVTRNRYTFTGWKVGVAAASPIYQITANTDFNSDFELDEPYTEITTKEQLAAIASSLSATTFSLSYKLMNPIDLEGVDFTPIGNYMRKFSGVFEGNGHTIKGLAVNYGGYAGLFGNIAGGARIANLTVEITGAGIRGTATGGIAGYADGTNAGSPVKIVNAHVRVKEGESATINGICNVINYYNLI
jgi:uncharacterized repeat protein (TIGR02543 family)